VEVFFPVFILRANKERRRIFSCGISVTPKVSQVLGELSAGIEIENGELNDKI
jgi:hypothetical protein